MIQVKQGGDDAQKPIEHLALGAIVNALLIQITRYRKVIAPRQTHKQDINKLFFAAKHIADFLKVEKGHPTLTAQEQEEIGDNISLTSSAIHKFCRIAAQIPSDNYHQLINLVDEIEREIIKALPKQHAIALKTKNV